MEELLSAQHHALESNVRITEVLSAKLYLARLARNGLYNLLRSMAINLKRDQAQGWETIITAEIQVVIKVSGVTLMTQARDGKIASQKMKYARRQ